ncbi:MAG: alpha/beta hydrolase [Phycisphaerae bacterium]
MFNRLKLEWMAAALVLALTAPAMASPIQHAVIPVWPHLRVALSLRTAKSKVVPELGRVLFPPVRWPTLTEYLAPKSQANGCAVISCPGGGYGVLCVHWEGTRVAKWLNRIGVSCFVLQYRLPDGKLPPSGVPWPLQDIRRAVQIVRAHAGKWHINPHDIGVAGFSAGGSVASLAGVHWLPGNPNAKNPLDRFSTRPDFLILGYPVISMMPGITNIGTRNNLLGANPPQDVAEYFSSELNVTPLTPPAFICYAHNDTVVAHQNEIRFYKALKRNGVPAQLRVYKVGEHGFVSGPKHGVSKWSQACKKWLRRMHFIPRK